MTGIGKIVIGIMVLAAFAAVIAAVLLNEKERSLSMALYHLSQDGGAFVDYENLAGVKAAIAYPAEQGEYIVWEVVYDGYEEGPKVVPPWGVELGKDDEGLYHKNPFGNGTRIGVSTPAENNAFLDSLPH